MQIVDQYGKEYKVEPTFSESPQNLGEEISSADSSMFDDYQLRPFNPAELWQQRGDYSLYDEMREDDQISAVLLLKKIIVLNSNWKIDGEDEDVNEFIEDCFNIYMDDLFIKKMLEVISAYDYGFSLTEKIPDVIDFNGATKIAFTKLKTRAPHSITFEQDSMGNVTEIKQDTADGEIILDPKRFMIYTYQKEFDNPYGNSDLNKGVYRAWWSKENIIKFWNIFLERHGMPFTTVTMPRGGGNQEKDRIQKILRNLQAKTAMTMPDDWKLEMHHVASGTGQTGFEAAIDKYNTMIARRMLIPDLMGFSGKETSGGSFALGQEQFDIFFTIIEYLRQDLERLITKELVNPLVFWNFGSSAKADFKFEAIDADKDEQNLKLWLDAVKSGKIPTTDESTNWFLQQVQAPEISEQELAEIKAEKEAMALQISGGNDNGLDSKNDVGNNPVGNKAVPKQGDKEAGKKSTAARVDNEAAGDSADTTEYASAARFRQLTRFEKKTDFKEIDKQFDELTNKFMPLLGDAFKLVINGLANDILQKNIITKKRIEQVNKLSLRNMGKVEKVLTALMRDSFSDGKAGAIKEVNKTNFVIDVNDALTDADIIEWFKQFAFTVSTSEAAFILKRAKPILMDAIRNGLGTQETIAILDEALKDYDIAVVKEVDGEPVEVVSRGARLEAIVRTNINQAFNEARLRQFEGISEELAGYFYSAILDGRTSEICLSLDSGINDIIYTVQSGRAINPPNHFNCRSVLVPIFKEENPENVEPLPEKFKQGEGGFLNISKEEKKRIRNKFPKGETPEGGES